MKKEELFEKAFDLIDDNMIADAQTIIPIVKRKRPKAFLLAACVTLLLSALFFTLGIADTKKEIPLPGTVPPPSPPIFYYQSYNGAPGKTSSVFSSDALIMIAACLLLLLSVYCFIRWITSPKTSK